LSALDQKKKDKSDRIASLKVSPKQTRPSESDGSKETKEEIENQMRINRDKLSEATGNKHRLEIEIEVLNANYDSLDKLRDELESELKTVKTNLNKLDEDYSKKKQSLLEI